MELKPNCNNKPECIKALLDSIQLREPENCNQGRDHPNWTSALVPKELLLLENWTSSSFSLLMYFNPAITVKTIAQSKYCDKVKVILPDETGKTWKQYSNEYKGKADLVHADDSFIDSQSTEFDQHERVIQYIQEEYSKIIQEMKQKDEEIIQEMLQGAVETQLEIYQKLMIKYNEAKLKEEPLKVFNILKLKQPGKLGTSAKPIKEKHSERFSSCIEEGPFLKALKMTSKESDERQQMLEDIPSPSEAKERYERKDLTPIKKIAVACEPDAQAATDVIVDETQDYLRGIDQSDFKEGSVFLIDEKITLHFNFGNEMCKHECLSSVQVKDLMPIVNSLFNLWHCTLIWNQKELSPDKRLCDYCFSPIETIQVINRENDEIMNYETNKVHMGQLHV